MKIKTCGLFREEDFLYAAKARPDFAGVIISQGYRRSILPERVKEYRKHLPEEIALVGVFVNEEPDYIISLLEDHVIDLAQLHGEEQEEDIMYIKAVTGKPVIKAVKAMHSYEVEAWLDTCADYLLFDSGAGSGKVFDWGLLKDIDREYFLAGGLCMENLKQVLDEVSPYGVDVSSGIETDGIKDLEKMEAMVRMVRSFGNHNES